MDKRELMEFAESAHAQAAGLVRRVPEDSLGWRPVDTDQWWTVGQLLQHLPDAAGGLMNGLINGRWPEDHGEDFPAVASVADAVARLEESRKLTRRLLAALSDQDLHSRKVVAPWDVESQVALPLSTHLFGAVLHLVSHKTQLYMYLKLLGVSVNTGDLWGMQ